MEETKKKVHDIRTGTELDEEDETSYDEEESSKRREQIRLWIRGSKKRTV